MATAHLVCGYLGAGKTTLAKQLEREHDAVRFTPDEWMARLFGEDPPSDTFQQDEAAILALMEPLWTRCLSLGLDVILDFGFWRREDRDSARRLTDSVGAKAALYLVVCAEDEARRRVAARNNAVNRSLFIAPATFDGLKSRFEPPGPDEDYIVA